MLLLQAGCGDGLVGVGQKVEGALDLARSGLAPAGKAPGEEAQPNVLPAVVNDAAHASNGCRHLRQGSRAGILTEGTCQQLLPVAVNDKEPCFPTAADRLIAAASHTALPPAHLPPGPKEQSQPEAGEVAHSVIGSEAPLLPVHQVVGQRQQRLALQDGAVVLGRRSDSVALGRGVGGVLRGRCSSSMSLNITKSMHDRSCQAAAEGRNVH